MQNSLIGKKQYYAATIMTVYNPETEIIHFSANQKIDIKTSDDLELLNSHFISKIKELAQGKRVYFMIDLNKIILEPEIAKSLTICIKEYFIDYLYPNGGCAYGQSLGRLALKMSFHQIDDQEEKLFLTKEEAIVYLRFVRDNNRTNK